MRVILKWAGLVIITCISVFEMMIGILSNAVWWKVLPYIVVLFFCAYFWFGGMEND